MRETVEEVGFDPLAHGRLLGPLETVHGGARQVFVAAFAVEIASDIEPSPSVELPGTWWMAFVGVRGAAGARAPRCRTRCRRSSASAATAAISRSGG